MKLFPALAAGGLALAIVAGPVAAQRVTHTTTTVTRVHGPLRVLPHHKRKVCRSRVVNHRRVQKCSYG